MPCLLLHTAALMPVALMCPACPSPGPMTHSYNSQSGGLMPAAAAPLPSGGPLSSRGPQQPRSIPVTVWCSDQLLLLLLLLLLLRCRCCFMGVTARLAQSAAAVVLPAAAGAPAAPPAPAAPC